MQGAVGQLPPGILPGMLMDPRGVGGELGMSPGMSPMASGAQTPLGAQRPLQQFQSVRLHYPARRELTGFSTEGK